MKCCATYGGLSLEASSVAVTRLDGFSLEAGAVAVTRLDGFSLEASAVAVARFDGISLEASAVAVARLDGLSLETCAVAVARFDGISCDNISDSNVPSSHRNRADNHGHCHCRGSHDCHKKHEDLHVDWEEWKMLMWRCVA